MKARIVTKAANLPDKLPKNHIEAFFKGKEDALLERNLEISEAKWNGFYAINRVMELAYYNTIEESVKTKKTQDNLIQSMETRMTDLLVDKYEEDLYKILDEKEEKPVKERYIPKNLRRNNVLAYIKGKELGLKEADREEYNQTVKGFYAGFKLIKESYYDVVGSIVKTPKTQEKIFKNIKDEIIRLFHVEFKEDNDRITVGLSATEKIREYFNLEKL